MTDDPICTLSTPFSKHQIQSVRRNTTRCRTLRYIDITECSCISFYATILLREQLHHPELIIRRIPKWMEGHYDTMYPNDGIHTYYADGTFLYDRSSSNCGYVCDLWKWPTQQPISSFTTSNPTTGNPSQHSCLNDDFATYGDCLRFINVSTPQYLRWQKLFTDLFYPGVTLSPFYSEETVDDSFTDDEVPTIRIKNINDGSVIVVQNVDGIVLPTQSYRCPIFRNAAISILQLGKSVYRDADGNLLSDNTDHAVFRVTRMQKYPIYDEMYSNISSKGNISDPDLQQCSFQRNSSMPPDHIIAAIQISEEQRMLDNVVIGSHVPYWTDDRGLLAAVELVNQALFRSQQTVESSDQFIRMIRRQKSMIYN